MIAINGLDILLGLGVGLLFLVGIAHLQRVVDRDRQR